MTAVLVLLGVAGLAVLALAVYAGLLVRAVFRLVAEARGALQQRLLPAIATTEQAVGQFSDQLQGAGRLLRQLDELAALLGPALAALSLLRPGGKVGMVAGIARRGLSLLRRG